jgi:phage repressor protein C with HTH and peptisase S24 domain
MSTWATHHITKLNAGETVSFRPRGNSMVPLIKSGELCTVVPVGTTVLITGQIVLCKVKGKHYLHIITGVKPDQVQISNNKGFVNGWTPLKNVFGVLTSVSK